MRSLTGKFSFSDDVSKTKQAKFNHIFPRVSLDGDANAAFHIFLFISLIRMRSKRDIKMGRLCTPGGAVLGIVGGGVRFRFLNGEVIFEEYMLFWVRLYALVVVLKILLDFSL